MKEHLSCSEITKRKIAFALKELMETIPFEKITISDISQKSGIHRQTFYYHFQDRYELLDWLLNMELVSNFIEDFSYENIENKFYEVFNTIYTDKKFYQNAVNINMTDVYKYFARLSTKQLLSLVNTMLEKNMIEDGECDAISIAEFFGFGLGGMIISWIERGMKETPTEMAKNVVDFINKFARLVTNK